MVQILPTPTPTHLRERLGVDPLEHPDEELQAYLDGAAALVGAELDPDGDYTIDAGAAANVSEAITQVACSVWDTRARGMVTVTPVGDFEMPAARATRGLILSVRGLLLPHMPTGGITV